MPCSFTDLTDLQPQLSEFKIKTLLSNILKVGNVWKELISIGQKSLFIHPLSF